MATLDAVLHALKKCQRTLRQLKAGQQLSQRAGNTFTELATEVANVCSRNAATGRTDASWFVPRLTAGDIASVQGDAPRQMLPGREALGNRSNE